MNKNNILIVILGTLLLLASCQDEMDYNESVGYNKQQVFSSFDRTGQFVSTIYSQLYFDFGNFGGAMLASASDEAEYAWSSSTIHDFYNGSWSPTNAKAELWNTNYEAIRAVNFYLVASQGQTFEPFKHNKDYNSQMERFNRYQYEVRFLRVYFYFNLIRQFGDVPFTTEVLTDTEANKLTRTSYNEIFDFIITECDAIAEHLPISYYDTEQKETGRVNRIAVLALKARSLLYKASPLFNTSNNKTYWYDAAIASKAVIDICAANNVKLGNYTDLWGTESYKASEGIFIRRVGDLNYLEAYNFPIGVEGGKSGNCPTQTLVDAYEMKSTGLAWNEPGSGFNANKPYENRDPRLDMTIAKNGDLGWPTYNSLELQTYEGGVNGSPIAGATPTSYYLKKYCDASVDLRPNYSNTKRHSWITFRLGEFYLNYAEATFRYLESPDATDSDLTLSAREAINVIRKRSGVNMPEFPTGMSNSDFEKKYMNERMVELAFEGHRFWDVRRWEKGELLKSIDRMKITKTGTVFTFTREKKERSWNDKMYFFPISDSERRKNPNLIQNTGW